MMPNRLDALADLSDAARADWYASLKEDEADVLGLYWPLWARAEQMPPTDDWHTWLICAGRGFGKTRAGAEWVRAVARSDPEARIALLTLPCGSAGRTGEEKIFRAGVSARGLVPSRVDPRPWPHLGFDPLRGSPVFFCASDPDPDGPRRIVPRDHAAAGQRARDETAGPASGRRESGARRLGVEGGRGPSGTSGARSRQGGVRA